MQILLFIITTILMRMGLAFMSNECLRPLNLSLLNNIPQIESGHRNIVWSQKDQEQSSVTIPYNKVNQRQDLVNVIVSLVLLTDFDRPSQSIYLQLYPQILKFGQFNTIVKFNKKTRYRSIHIHFVVSSSFNLRVGLKQLDSSQLEKINIDVSAKKAEPFRVNVLDFNLTSVADKHRVITNTTGYAFLSGFKSNSPNFELFIIQQNNINGPKNGILRILINATVTRKPVDILKISYFMVFQYQNQKQTAYLRIQNYLSGVSQYSSIMNGTTGFKGSNIDYLKSAQRLRLLEQRTVEYDPKKIFNEKDVRRFSLVFSTFQMALVDMAIQVPIAKQSLKSTIPLLYQIKNLIQKGKCIRRNTCQQYNGQIVKSQNQSKCLFCSDNQLFNQQCQQCQCKDGYYRPTSGTQCKKIDQCPDGQTFSDGICYFLMKVEESCVYENKIYNKTTKKCDCPPNYKYLSNDIGKLCIPPCQQCEVYNVISKKCEPFCLMKMGKRVKCDSHYYINAQKKTCDCKDSTIRGINGNCVVCPYGTVANLEKQTCDEVDDQTFRKARIRP